MTEQLGYFGVIQNAVRVPLPDHMKVKFRPISEYDGISNVMLRADLPEGRVEAFGCWSDDHKAYCEIFGCEVVPLTWSPSTFSYLSDQLAMALAVI